ncbi:MAG TPA: GTPase HflX [Burkholderiales bacterium]|jgi:GTP-binding protein HflX|nr:GTPase HflX [Burkholderiales bacterium]
MAATSDKRSKAARAIVAAVQLPSVGDAEFESSLSELRQLAKTLGFEVVSTFTQKRAGFDSAGYFGVGKREELKALVEGGIDVILVDHEISPSQSHALEKETGVEVMDRTMVILEIFHRHAKSRAARAQVEIARLGYMAPRMREASKLAGPKDRGRSGTGGRSGGESFGELDSRKIRDRMAELKRELEGMTAGRETQRTRRKERQGLARVALVGYTNAGKSTLMRALTGSEVLVANKLFATLDTTVRALHPESKPRILVSDTVGFIKNLPHGLVVSFKSTLDEALEASLLAHVVDASDPGFERQLAVTEQVLAEIGAKDVPRLLVFNKIDRAGDAAAQQKLATELRARHPDCLVMSARSAEDVAALHGRIVAFFQRGLVEAELFLPWSEQKQRAEIFASCQVLGEHAEAEGAVLRVRGEAATVRRLEKLFASRSAGRREASGSRRTRPR